MPRKPKPPNHALLIEGLSIIQNAREDVRELRAKLTFVDDLGGENTVHEIKPEIAQRIVQRANMIEDYAERMKAHRIAYAQGLEADAERKRKVAEAIVDKQFKPQPPTKPFRRRF